MADKVQGPDKLAKKSGQKVKRKMSSQIKALIIIGAVLGVSLVGYLVYAYVVSNVIDSCIPQNDYCGGIFPFEKKTNSSDGGSLKCLEKDVDGSCLIHDLPRVEKPVIYLYPKSTLEVSVNLGYPDKLTAFYPNYNDGWEVLARPDGTLTDLKTNRELYSLYWEGEDGDFEMANEGFVVKGTDIAEFLEEKLAVLGLNARESEEFIIYWLPQLQENEYNYIRFASMEEINDYMPLNVDPQPDTVIRILMLYKPLDTAIEVNEQQLGPTPSRDGFTLVEWGGSKME